MASVFGPPRSRVEGYEAESYEKECYSSHRRLQRHQHHQDERPRTSHHECPRTSRHEGPPRSHHEERPRTSSHHERRIASHEGQRPRTSRLHDDGRSRTTLASLPPEIHLNIVDNLIYPDRLALKHTNRYFYCVVDTGVKVKVDWLMSRRILHLRCPNNVRCDLGSDLRFCRGSVALLMKHRREHIECESKPGLGCLVFGTSICTHRRKPLQRLKRWLRAQLTVELWWVLLAAAPLMLSWMWLAEMFS